MVSNISIVNTTGISNDTHIYVAGVEMRGIKKITIAPIQKNHIISATIEVIAHKFDLSVTDMQVNEDM